MAKTYYSRTIDKELLTWSKENHRKTLLIRGARQIGKSSAVRHLGESFNYYVEVNFDEQIELHGIFEQSFSPREICEQLSFLYRIPIIAGETLLFFDEIQSCIPAMNKLRYFYEKYPELHLIAAGSLLEFAIEEMPSFGVGRIRSMFMYPFAFDEFLDAMGDGMLIDAYRKASPAKPLMEPVHHQIINRLKIFLIIGGMPESVSEYVKNRDLLRCQRILNDLIITFRNDFAKYKKKIPALRINEVFESVANQSKGKFVYERTAIGVSTVQVKQALDLLIMAGLVYPVTHSSANGIPLGAEVNLKFRRMILFDTGLFQRILNLDVAQLLLSDDFKTVNRGSLAEIFVGLELLKGSSCYDMKQLYYWQREKKQGNAQVDYLIQKGEQIVPIEVKAGTQGTMQSLRLFMEEKKIDIGVRTSLENFGKYENIEVYPMYAIANLL
jgi:predicted AAA+ superfamily ATPase